MVFWKSDKWTSRQLFNKSPQFSSFFLFLFPNDSLRFPSNCRVMWRVSSKLYKCHKIWKSGVLSSDERNKLSTWTQNIAPFLLLLSGGISHVFKKKKSLIKLLSGNNWSGTQEVLDHQREIEAGEWLQKEKEKQHWEWNKAHRVSFSSAYLCVCLRPLSI